MKIAIDIDSTLHHYWGQLADAAQRRFGIELRYEEQVTWEIDLLRPEQVAACVAETHCDDAVLSAKPYPDAVKTVTAWHRHGHYIHITSHRVSASEGATARWLEQIALPFNDLYCSGDKIARAREIGIELLIDDAPENLQGAIDAGIRAATILHPWNRELCESEDIVYGETWAQLRERLAPLLESNGSAQPTARASRAR